MRMNPSILQTLEAVASHSISQPLWLWSMSLPSLGPIPASSLTECSLIVCDEPLQSGAGEHAPSITVFAPGKPANMLSKLRFSCTITTTCEILPDPAPLGGGTVTTLELLQPAMPASAATKIRASNRFMTPPTAGYVT